MSNNTAVAVSSRPEIGDRVVIEFDGDQYTLIMNDGEIDVIGGETGRVSAFYDSNNHLNIIGGGSLKASAITLVSDNTVTGKFNGGKSFWNYKSYPSRLQNLQVNQLMLHQRMEVLMLTLMELTIAVNLAADGSISHTPSTTGFSASFNITNGTTGRLTLEHTLATGPINFPTDNSLKSFGFPVSEYGLKLLTDKIQVTSSLGNMVDMTANATSIAEKSMK